MARKVGLSTGKKVKRVIPTGRGGGFKRAASKERVNLSNIYGIMSGGTGNKDGAKGAVHQNKPGNKHSVTKAKRKIRGS